MRHDKKFLDHLLGRQVDVYLISGIRLSARLAAQLPYAVILDDDHHSCQMLVYKHAIATITTARSQRP